MVGICIGEGVHVGSTVRAGDNVCVVGMRVCTMCVCVNACVGEGRVGELHVGGVCAAWEVYGVIVVCMGAGSTVRAGDNVRVVAMCACTMCVRVNARVGEGMVGELHVGGVCAACEVYGLIVVCAGAGSTVRAGDNV